MKCFGKKRAGKLRSYWEKDVYVIVSSDPDLLTYKIKPANFSKPIPTVHRNLLLNYTKLHIEISSSYSRLKVLSPQNPSASAESQTESESD